MCLCQMCPGTAGKGITGVVGTLVPGLGAQGSLSQGGGDKQVAVMGLGQGGNTGQNLFTIQSVRSQEGRWLSHPSPVLWDTDHRVPRPPQAQKRVQRHPLDPGMMEMGRATMEHNPRASAFFSPAQLGAAPEPCLPMESPVGAQRGAVRGALRAKIGCRIIGEAVILGGVRCCRGGCGRLKGVQAHGQF